MRFSVHILAALVSFSAFAADDLRRATPPPPEECRWVPDALNDGPDPIEWLICNAPVWPIIDDPVASPFNTGSFRIVTDDLVVVDGLAGNRWYVENQETLGEGRPGRCDFFDCATHALQTCVLDPHHEHPSEIRFVSSQRTDDGLMCVVICTDPTRSDRAECKDVDTCDLPGAYDPCTGPCFQGPRRPECDSEDDPTGEV